MVSDMRHLLNTFNSAVQLPSDILVTVPSFLFADQDLFAISQVCHRWRTVLVSFPLLWRRMDCRNLTWTIVGLKRHPPVPLQLELDYSFSTEALTTVLDHGSKIVSLSVHLPYNQLQLFHPRLVTPSLEELLLFVDEDEDHIPEEKITMDI